MFKPDEATIAKTLDRLSGQAETILRDAQKLRSLISDAIKKTRELEIEGEGPLANAWNDILAILRMLEAYADGKYTTIPWGSIVSVTAAVIYLVSPVDLIPDEVPVAGYLDDAAVLAFVLPMIMKDIEHFRAWEAGRATAVAPSAS